MDSPTEMVREATYKVYYWEEEGQESLLKDMIADRHQLGRLCGYRTFAHRALNHSLAENPENIGRFMAQLGRELPARVGRDHEAMLNMKRRSNPLCRPLALWDVPYYSSLARANWFKLDTERIAEYFSLGVAMEGLNDLFQSLYGVSLSVEPAQDGELWSPDVFKLAVMEDSGRILLGHIYCDFFSRPGKPHQDCHFTIRGGRQRSDGTYQNPVVVLMLNMTAPGWRSPTLLSPSALDNLFHEMGHAMHSMLGRTKYQHVTGTRCSTDFAEVPSTLMEYFAADPRVLLRMNKHYKTGESLPLPVIEKICATKKIFAAAEMQTQLVYSVLDQVGR
jgi:intermediate peptidase